jgi:hypothetical protein
LRPATTIATNGEIVYRSVGRDGSGSGGGGSIDESESTVGSEMMLRSGTDSGSATTTGSGGIEIIDAQPVIASSARTVEDRESVNRTSFQIINAQNSAATFP